MIDHVNAYALIVQDVQRSVEFYRDTLGFKPVELQTNFAYLEFKEDSAGVALISAKGLAGEIGPRKMSVSADAPYRGFFAIFLDDFDREYRDLTSKGVKFVSAPATRANGQRYAFFEDPDGNLWEISQFPNNESVPPKES